MYIWGILTSLIKKVSFADNFIQGMQHCLCPLINFLYKQQPPFVCMYNTGGGDDVGENSSADHQV